MAKLLPGFHAIALKLQEDATDLSHNDIRSRLQDAMGDGCYVCDVFGDDDSGDVVYHGPDGTQKAGYQFSTVNGKQTASVDTDNAVDVVPRTTYEEQADDDDSYASMEADRKRENLYIALPVYERFISKSERDSADSGSFAGKGKSFPILKPGDVMAAVRSMGRAGSDNVGTSTLKKNIIAIAKKKGWTKYLPKAWQGDGAKESKISTNEGIRLFESAATLEPIVLKEAKADYEIKLIAPGKGSSAFYPAEVLKRDGPAVFREGTHVYLNHPTAEEERQRPEGDVKNLAGVLTTQAAYHESHPKGPGLYARMKVFADHASMVEEKASHVGMSIRASGKAEAGGKTREGLPVLAALTSAESVDVVTKAGAGGMILTEAAKPQEGELTLQEAQRLIDQAVQPFREKALKSDARDEAQKILEAVTLPPKAKERIITRALEGLPVKDGAIDMEAFRALVVKEAKAEGQYLAEITGSGRVIGMGLPADPPPDKKESKRLKEARKEEKREAVSIFESLGLPKEAAKFAAKGRVA